MKLVDLRYPLLRLAGLIDWERFAATLTPLYREGVGGPVLPPRLIIGPHPIRHMDGLSGDAVCARFLDSPYAHPFCRETIYGRL